MTHVELEFASVGILHHVGVDFEEAASRLDAVGDVTLDVLRILQ